MRLMMLLLVFLITLIFAKNYFKLSEPPSQIVSHKNHLLTVEKQISAYNKELIAEVIGEADHQIK